MPNRVKLLLLLNICNSIFSNSYYVDETGNIKLWVLICTKCPVTLGWLVDWRLEEMSLMLAQVNIYEWVNTVNWLFTAPLVCNALVFWSSHSNSTFSANKLGVCMSSAGVYLVSCPLSEASCTHMNVASLWAGCFLTVAMAFPYLFLLVLLSFTLLHHGSAHASRSRKAAAGKGNTFSIERKCNYKKIIEILYY